MAQKINLLELEELHRAKWNAATREAYLKEHPENFAGPDGSYPIRDSEDVESAWNLAGHAESPDTVRAKIKSIAKRLDLTSSLPDTAKDDSEDRVAEVEEAKEEVERTVEVDPQPEQPVFPTHASLYAPITRIDASKREVECVATSEALDSYKTIFSYEASKRAFQKWIDRTANVREMHERKAVAKGVGVFFDDDAKQVFVRTRVSRGAPDTWAKIEDGVLSGYSVGATNPVWSTIERNGKTYPYLTEYELNELSLVDNPSNPDAFGLTICRADGLTDVVDVTEPEPPPADTTTSGAVTGSSSSFTDASLERAGAKVSASTRQGLHAARDGAIKSAMQIMQACGCEECLAACHVLDPDGDGDIDFMALNDTDDDAAQASEDDMAERMEKALERALAPIYARQQQFLARLAQQNFDPIEIPAFPSLDGLQAQLTDLQQTLARVADSTHLDKVSADLAAVKDQVDRIAAQPAPGGPLLNGARPVDKSLATDPRPSQFPAQQESTLDVLNRLQQMGAFDTIEKQVAAAALAAQPARGRTR
jgi:hypothetical protein